MKHLALLPIIFAFSMQSGSSQTPDLYLGLTPPGNTPEVFAPGIVSLSDRHERAITFSQSGHEIFFAIGDWPTRTTMYIEYADGAWASPAPALFSIDRSAEEPSFSPDGNRVYYYAYPPGSSDNADIYYSEKTDTGWSAPINLGSTLNTSGDEFHPNVVNDGSIYFANGAGQTYRSQYSGGSFLDRVRLPDNVNSGVWPDHYVSPDESYMIFTSTMAGGFGLSDLYVSFRNADSSWTTPQNLGNKINTAGREGSADVTPDGKYMTYDNINDIFWVKIDNVIDSLKSISGVISSIEKTHKNMDFNIFPNPSTGSFSLSFAALPGQTACAEISNSQGDIILKRKVENNSIIDLTSTRKGLYFVKLMIGQEIIVRKACIQ